MKWMPSARRSYTTPMKRLLILLISMSMLGGCGTFLSLGVKPPVYSGIRYDGTLIVEGTVPVRGGPYKLDAGLRVLGVLDFPLSLGLDTAILPITLIVWLVQALSGDETPE